MPDTQKFFLYFIIKLFFTIDNYIFIDMPKTKKGISINR